MTAWAPASAATAACVDPPLPKLSGAMKDDDPLRGMRLLMFVDDVYEDLELWYPKLRLTEAGGHVTVAGPQMGGIYRGKHGYPCRADAALAEMEEPDFHGLIIPGGFMPDKLRRDQGVLRLVRAFAAAGKLVAAICHGGWIPISAGVYRGVRVTGSLGIKDDLINAGAIWEDAPVVVDRNFVSSRKPDDLPDFCRGIIAVLTGSQ
ncbi:MAG: type 1 glutamine amidotransferase [Pirellulales bacterium]|nr:type 1 glutamine amidotransferase [Pirellulales bacterium]